MEQFSKISLSTIPEEPKSTPNVSVTNELDIEIKPTLDLDIKPLKTPLVYHPPPRKVFSPCAFRKQFKSAKIPGCSERLGIPHDKMGRDSMVDPLLHHIATHDKPLFDTVVGDTSKAEPSILITGFGLRNLSSLQDALNLEEANRLKELYKAQVSETYLPSPDSSESIITKADLTSGTQTEVLSTSTEVTSKKRMMYLLGIKDMGEEEGGSIEMEQPKGEEEETGTTEAMRQAQKYLRIHEIFKFFQFIIAHLLSDLPENPIQFIIDLLDKCLVFRAGFTEPPLLYTRKHLECLFYLMDRMRTGYIEPTQYNTGMRTLGICTYNEHPTLTSENLVTKEEFIDEAYNRLTDQMNEMVRRRWLRGPPPITPPPPPTLETLSSSLRSADLECPDLANYELKSEPDLPYTKTKLFIDCDL